jgi:hypothetical protein
MPGIYDLALLIAAKWTFHGEIHSLSAQLFNYYNRKDKCCPVFFGILKNRGIPLLFSCGWSRMKQ